MAQSTQSLGSVLVFEPPSPQATGETLFLLLLFIMTKAPMAPRTTTPTMTPMIMPVLSSSAAASAVGWFAEAMVRERATYGGSVGGVGGEGGDGGYGGGDGGGGATTKATWRACMAIWPVIGSAAAVTPVTVAPTAAPIAEAGAVTRVVVLAATVASVSASVSGTVSCVSTLTEPEVKVHVSTHGS